MIDNTDAEYEHFVAVCARLGGFDRRLDAEWIDGYLSALAAGPRAVALDEWLPRLCEDAFTRAFADPDDVADAHKALQARMRMLMRQLDPEVLLDDPDRQRLLPLVLGPGPDDPPPDPDHPPPPAGAIWAEGFEAALADYTADWGAPADCSEDDASALQDMLAVVTALRLADGSEAMHAHTERLYPQGLPTRVDLLSDAAIAVQDLRMWWVDHAPRPATRHVPPRPGRNDPCPCGSGLKFKRCHG